LQKISRDSVALQPVPYVLAEAAVRGGEVVRVALTRVVAIGASTPARIALDWPIVGCCCCGTPPPLLTHPLLMPALCSDAITLNRVRCAVDPFSFSARICPIPNAALRVASFL
jgi:hypothetical protein